MKIRSIRKAAGKTVTRLHHEAKVLKVKVAVPNTDKLFNFDIKSKQGAHILVLDPYGTLDDGMPLKVYQRIFGRGKEQTIGIDRATGELLTVSFAVDDDGKDVFLVGPLGMNGCNVPDMRLPPEWLPRLDELLFQKRPFRFAIDEITLLDFIAREVGYNEFAKNLVVRFHFDDGMLEVSSTCYRQVSKWQTISEMPTVG